MFYLILSPSALQRSIRPAKRFGGDGLTFDAAAFHYFLGAVLGFLGRCGCGAKGRFGLCGLVFGF